jgi:hypothetical protein
VDYRETNLFTGTTAVCGFYAVYVALDGLFDEWIASLFNRRQHSVLVTLGPARDGDVAVGRRFDHCAGAAG